MRAELGASLILAIGAQHAFLPCRGPRAEHVLPVCTVCALSDGLRALRSAWRPDGEALVAAGRAVPTWRAALATCLAFTRSNPHVHLDTVVVLGAISSRHAGQRVEFAAEVIAGPFARFRSPGCGVRPLQSTFARPGAWRVPDAGIGALMLAPAAGPALGG